MRTALIVGAFLVALLIGAGIGLKLMGWRLERTETRAAVAEDNTAARTIEVEGTQQLTAAADRLTAATNNLRNASHAQDIAAARDPEASDALPQSVIDRLASDRERLCASGVRCDGDAPAL